jgi:phosphate transport system substrate-binding protein
MKQTLWIVALLIVLGGAWFLFSQNKPAAESVIIKGSDTEVQLVSNLVEAFLETNPGPNISVTGGGSGAGIAALLNGEIDVANSSRPMSEEEVATAADKGLAVEEFILARDGLSLIVHPGNSVTSLTVDQIGQIYRREIKDWSEVGGAKGAIVLYGRQTTSGTYTFFRDTVVKGDYAATMLNMEGNEAIADGVQNDTQGIGYIGVGYAKDETGAPREGIAILNVASAEGSEEVSPLDEAAVLSGKYPIVRPIYQYLKALPAKGSAMESFLRFEASPEGHAVLSATGFYKTTAEDDVKNKALLDRIR